MTLAEISSSTVFERSSVSGPSSLQVWFFAVPSEDLHHRHGRGGVRHTPSLGSIAPGTSGIPGIGVFLARRTDGLLGRALVDVGEAHPLHRVQVVQVAPELLEAVRGRQRLGVVAQVVLTELAGGVAEIQQELGERRGAGPQIGRAAGELRRDHARAQRIHAREEGIAPRGAALHGDIVHEDRSLISDAIDIRSLTDHQATMVDARLHPADVVSHDEKNVRLLILRKCWAGHQCQCDKEHGKGHYDSSLFSHHFPYPFLMLTRQTMSGDTVSADPFHLSISFISCLFPHPLPVKFTLVKFSHNSLLLRVWRGTLQGFQTHLHANLVLVRHALHGQSLVVHSFGLGLLSLFLVDSTEEHIRIGIRPGIW